MPRVKRKVHCSNGAYVGGEWVDMEDIADKYNISNGSHKKYCGKCPRSRSRNSAERASGGYDVVIIGAGCIGAAIARELSKTKASVLLLEAADDVSQGATKGNSGIVHAGYDDKPGSIKSKYCWPGNQMFPQLDRELHFGYQLNGSMVVAKSEEDMRTLDNLMERGRRNGVKNLRIIDRDELVAKEPFIHEDAVGALYSPDAGTLIPYEYTIALAENAVDNGVEVRIRREVVSIKQVGEPGKRDESMKGRFKITAAHWEPVKVANRLNKDSPSYLSFLSSPLALACTALVVALSAMVKINNWVVEEQKKWLYTILGFGYLSTISLAMFLGSNADEDKASKKPRLSKSWSYTPSKGTKLDGLAKMEVIWADYIVNAAGCGSDKVAKMIGDDSFQVKPRMGEYVLLHKNEAARLKTAATLFPCPHPVYGKGVLVQATLWGNLILGPTARDTMKKNKSGKYVIDPDVRDEPHDKIIGYIMSKCRNLIPDFRADQVIHSFSGARAKNTTGDWIIGPVDDVPCFINAASIDSPGIAASPAIAVDVVRMLQEAGCKLEDDPGFNPNRAPIVVPKKGYKGLKFSKNDFWKVKDPKQNIICKCEKVTEQEVIDACRRSLPIDSTQAIRKRTRAGMGHCQADVENYDCEARVKQIIARECGIPISEVGGRPWPASSMLRNRQAYDDEQEKKRMIELARPGQTYKLHGAAT